MSSEFSTSIARRLALASALYVLLTGSRAALAMGITLAADPTGPMVMDAPSGVCTQVIPVWPGIPPTHPLANQNDPAIRTAAIAYAANETLRLRQAQFCTPVLAVQISGLSRVALPSTCTQPPEVAALVDPMHPLADAGRAEVVLAEQRFLEAAARVETLRKTCLDAATGSK